MTDCQIFISYRREGGADLAGRISDKLKSLGYRVFYDIESMRSGTFDTQILKAIESANDVLLVLPPKGLDRCVAEDDWVRQEIEHAIKCQKNIIPLLMRGFEFPAELPKSIAVVPKFEGVHVFPEYFNAVMDRILELVVSKPEAATGAPAGADADIDSGVRFLNYGLYPQALESLEKAMRADQSNPEVYFYTAAALLRGKRPFLVERNTIKRVEEYLNVAINIGHKGLYAYFLAYVQFDHHQTKKLRAVPGYQALLAKAMVSGVTEAEISDLFKLLKTQRPAEL